jgi:hypothetical protein
MKISNQHIFCILAIFIVLLLTSASLHAQGIDLSVNISAVTDTTIINPDSTSMNAVFSGSTFSYQITVSNASADSVNLINVVMLLPEHVQFLNSDLIPATISGSFVFWNLSSLSAQSVQILTANVQCADPLPVGLDFLLAQVQISCDQDTTLQNNSDSETIQVIHPAIPPDDVDVQIRLQAVADSTVERDGEEYPYLAPGDDVELNISLSNRSNAAANNIDVELNLPDDFTAGTFSPVPSQQSGTSIFWRVDSLEAMSDKLITLACKAPIENDQEGLKLLFASAIIENDSHPENNVDTLAVWLNGSPANDSSGIAINYETITDTTVIVDGLQYPATFKKEQYGYKITVVNAGPIPAVNVQVQERHDVDVKIVDATVIPDEQQERVLTWNLDRLEPGEEWTISLQAIADQSLTDLPHLIVTSAVVSGEMDSSLTSKSKDAYVYVIAPALRPPDMNLKMTVEADSFQVEEGDSIAVLTQSDTCRFKLEVSNRGEIEARAIYVSFACNDSLFITDAIPAPDVMKADNVIWRIDSLAAGKTLFYQCAVSLPMEMPVSRNDLSVQAFVYADNEDQTQLENNIESIRLINYGVVVEPMIPEIRITPETAHVDDSIRVQVRFPAQVKEWDIWIYLPDGQVVREFGDHFISTTTIEQAVWYDIEPRYQHPQIVGNGDQDELIFEVRATGLYNNSGSARAHVMVSSYLNVTLPNVMTPEDTDVPIELITSAAHVEIKAYDVSGRFIAQIADDDFTAGKHTLVWNGVAENGRIVGSGAYLLVMRIGQQNICKKIIIVR